MSSWTSAHFIGRRRELEVLDEALDGARRGQAHVVLIGAEAGAGKSRLIQEFAGRARSSAVVAEGRCVEQSDGGLTYGPIVALIRQIVRLRGIDYVRGLVDDDTAGDLAALVPSLGGRQGQEPSRARLFEAVVTLIDAFATEQPVVLIVEDVHWSDTATKDLLLYLASNLEGSGVVLIVSHRETGPNSSMTSFRVALMRLGYATTLQLTPLTLDETGEQLAAILGSEPAPRVVREVHERSGGLPFFTEALIQGDGTVRDAMPGDLRELIIAGVRVLPAETQESMHAASVGALEVDAGLLGAVLGLDASELARRLRPAVEAGLMTGQETAYRFRHELLREAVRDGELLPGESAALHRAYAVALESRPEWDPEQGRDGRIALHWRGALDHERALRSSWAVARRAHGTGAFVEELRMLEQALSVWDRVADPVASIGADRGDLLEAAVDAACWAAQSERGLALAEAALELLDTDEGPRRAEMLLQRSSLRRQLMLPGMVDDLAEASRIAGVAPLDRVEILAQLSRAYLAIDEPDAAAEVAAELGRVTETTTVPAARLESAVNDVLIAASRQDADRGSERIAQLRQAIDDASGLDTGWVEALAWMSVVRVAEQEGEHAQAVDLGRQALRRLRELGLTEYSGPAISAGLATAQLALGQRSGALDTVREAMALDPPPNGRAALLLAECEAHLASGEARQAERALADFDALVAGRHPEPAVQRLRVRLGPGVARARAQSVRHEPTRHGLTGREIEVLTLLADGLSNKEIGAQLFISTKTASVHVSNILRKLDVPARGAAVALAYRESIIDAPVGSAPGK